MKDPKALKVLEAARLGRGREGAGEPLGNGAAMDKAQRAAGAEPRQHLHKVGDKFLLCQAN